MKKPNGTLIIVLGVSILIILSVGSGYLLSNKNNNKSLKSELNSGAVAVGSGQTELGMMSNEGAMALGDSIRALGNHTDVFSDIVKK